jgi:hypothetical protein
MKSSACVLTTEVVSYELCNGLLPGALPASELRVDAAARPWTGEQLRSGAASATALFSAQRAWHGCTGQHHDLGLHFSIAAGRANLCLRSPGTALSPLSLPAGPPCTPRRPARRPLVAPQLRAGAQRPAPAAPSVHAAVPLLAAGHQPQNHARAGVAPRQVGVALRPQVSAQAPRPRLGPDAPRWSEDFYLVGAPWVRPPAALVLDVRAEPRRRTHAPLTGPPLARLRPLPSQPLCVGGPADAHPLAREAAAPHQYDRRGAPGRE